MADAVKVYSDEIVRRWNSEIDTLLVYAGLFSAILTAFNVQSYQLLTPPSTDPDAVLVTLQRISTQLNSFTVRDPFVNSTLPGALPSVSMSRTQPAPTWAIWLNTLWFSSLIVSLSAASVGIMVKQWLNEYSSGLSGTSHQTARLRQYRLNNLIKWRVGAIVALLPALLQIALALFLAGLLVLLWQMNDTVAIVASFLVGILACFTLTTIVLPSVAYGCSYLSPASFAVFHIVRLIQLSTTRTLRRVSRQLKAQGHKLPRFLALRRLRFSDAIDNFLAYAGMLWSTRERALLEATKHSLDTSILVMAYTTTMNVSYLDAASPCIVGFKPDETIRCFLGIERENARHRGEESEHFHWTYRAPIDFGSYLVFALLHASINGHDVTRSIGNLDEPMKYLFRCRRWDEKSSNLALMDLSAALSLDSSFYPDWWSQGEFRSNVLSFVSSHLSDMRETRLSLSITARQQLTVAMKCMLTTFPGTGDYFRALDTLLQLCSPDSGGGSAQEAETISTIRKYAHDVLASFGDLLGSQKWIDDTKGSLLIDGILDTLRANGDKYGVMSPKLVEGLIRALDASKMKSIWISEPNRTWIERLKLERDTVTMVEGEVH